MIVLKPRLYFGMYEEVKDDLIVLGSRLRETARAASRYLPYVPHLLYRTPEELEERHFYKESLATLGTLPKDHQKQFYRKLLSETRSLPRPRTIRVVWHPHSKSWLKSESALAHEFPLEPDGSFNLGLVMDHWKLQNCIPIDRRRGILFRPSVPDHMSPLALRVLLDKKSCLKVCEEPCQELVDIRRARIRIKDAIKRTPQVAKALLVFTLGLIVYLLVQTVFLVLRILDLVVYRIELLVKYAYCLLRNAVERYTPFFMEVGWAVRNILVWWAFIGIPFGVFWLVSQAVEVYIFRLIINSLRPLANSMIAPMLQDSD